MTQYVLVNIGQVINGPRAWNYRSFESTLLDDLQIEYSLPMSKDDEDIITINGTTVIYPAELVYQNCNQKTEYLHGPFWDFSSGKAIGTFEIVQHPLEVIKLALKAKVAENRWLKEIKGIKVTVQGVELDISTNRGERDIFIQKYLLLGDSETIQWKFGNTWLTLTKSDLSLIVSSINQHVQDQFDWEITKHSEIDAATLHEGLDAVDLGNVQNSLTGFIG